MTRKPKSKTASDENPSNEHSGHYVVFIVAESIASYPKAIASAEDYLGWIKSAEVARLAGVHASTLSRHIAKVTMRTKQIGKFLLIHPEDAFHYIKNQQVKRKIQNASSESDKKVQEEMDKIQDRNLD